MSERPRTALEYAPDDDYQGEDDGRAYDMLSDGTPLRVSLLEAARIR